jgi:hypothetical protein
MGPDFWDNPNGPYENRCPFCYVVEKFGGNPNEGPGMKDIPHASNCVWLVAKDLYTGNEKEKS